jgi:acetolactate decarboxylase
MPETSLLHRNSAARVLFTLATLPFLWGLQACMSMSSAEPQQLQPSAAVEWAGNRRVTVAQGDLSSKIDLATLKSRPSLYGLGPGEGLRGEVQIFNGQSLLSTVDAANREVIAPGYFGGAPFFVWAQVRAWKAYPLPAGVRTMGQLEASVSAAARAHGVDLSRPFAFRLVGTARQVDYHIVFKRDDKPHNNEEHNKIKYKFKATDAAVEMLGFWSDKHAGVFLPGTSSIHIHFRTQNGAQAGHVDDFTLSDDVQLMLPL